MKKVIKILGKVFVVLFAIMTITNVAEAATNSADVTIGIEASENLGVIQNEGSIQTGDAIAMAPYIIWIVLAGAVIAICIKQKKKAKQVFMVLAAVFLSVACLGHTSQAAETTENVDVTVPASISMIFDEKGENQIDVFEIENQSLVPIIIEKISVTQCNGWQLATETEQIPVDTKKLAFSLEGQYLQAGENLVGISISENSSRQLDLQVRRGAWTEAVASETALNLEFEYALGTKQFQLVFDANGDGTDVTVMNVSNGETVTLPQPEKKCYAFKGWQDEEGNLYTSEFVMPIGNVNLTAKWQKTEAYAVYSKDDNSLTFYRSETPIQVGEIHNNKTVTAVYSGMETDTYVYATVPWRSYEEDITSIVFHDIVMPNSTAFWFRHLISVTYVDVTNLDLTQATSMQYTFMHTGYSAEEIRFVGLEDLDVSNIQSMWQTFDGCGQLAKKVYIGDLSKWDVSNVTTMIRMFCFVGTEAEELYLTGVEGWNVSKVTNMSMMFYKMATGDDTWSVNLSKWDVGNVEKHVDFCLGTETKVTEPNWVQ